jgi:hypothetical protein
LHGEEAFFSWRSPADPEFYSQNKKADEISLSASSSVIIVPGQAAHFFLWTAFHLAHRAFWASAMRLRAAADI